MPAFWTKRAIIPLKCLAVNETSGLGFRYFIWWHRLYTTVTKARKPIEGPWILSTDVFPDRVVGWAAVGWLAAHQGEARLLPRDGQMRPAVHHPLFPLFGRSGGGLGLSGHWEEKQCHSRVPGCWACLELLNHIPQVPLPTLEAVRDQWSSVTDKASWNPAAGVWLPGLAHGLGSAHGLCPGTAGAAPACEAHLGAGSRRQCSPLWTGRGERQEGLTLGMLWTPSQHLGHSGPTPSCEEGWMFGSGPERPRGYCPQIPHRNIRTREGSCS